MPATLNALVQFPHVKSLDGTPQKKKKKIVFNGEHITHLSADQRALKLPLAKGNAFLPKQKSDW